MAAWARSATGRAWLLLVALVVVWGCHWTVAKVGLEAIPPFTYAMLRLLVAMAVLAALMQIGLPPSVEPCLPGTMRAATAGLAYFSPSGRPPPTGGERA